MVLAVLMPVYNERSLLERAVDRLLAVPPPPDPGDPAGRPLDRVLFVVDDGSTDGTTEIADQLGARPGVVVIKHAQNKGKGAAIRSAHEAALAWRSAEGEPIAVFLIHDADLEYDPADHAAVLTPILDGRADAVIGSRFLGAAHRVLYYWHYVANRVITTFCNMLTNLNLSDIECCFKAWSRPVATQLTLEEERFGIEPEIVAKLSRMRLEEGGSDRPLRIFEVGVTYAGRTYAEGKKIRWSDGVSALRCIISYTLMR